MGHKVVSLKCFVYILHYGCQTTDLFFRVQIQDRRRFLKMTIFKRDSLLAKLNRHYLKTHLKIYSHFERAKWLWQSNSLKPASLNLSFNHRGQLCYPVNSANIKTAPMAALTDLVIQPQYQPFLNYQKSTINKCSIKFPVFFRHV